MNERTSFVVLALLSVAAACSSGGTPLTEQPTDSAVRAADAGAAPHVVETSPELGESNVYPSPYGDGSQYRVEISVQFSAAMDTRTAELPFGPANQALSLLPVKWAPDGRSLGLTVTPLPLATQILAEDTPYEFDLSSLTDVMGQSLAPSVGLEQGRLRFATGKYDALLNHSCGHTVFGPFDNGVASRESPPVFTASNTHTQYALSFLASDAGIYTGVIGLRLPVAGMYRLYFDGLPSLDVVRADTEMPASVLPTARSCAGIIGQLDVEVATDELIELRLRTEAPLMHLIVEALVQ